MPSRFRALLVALLLVAGSGTQARAASSPALWLVQGAKAKVYVFGTIHVLKPGVVWSTPAIDKALADSDDLWLEVADDLQDPTALLPQIQSLAMDPAHPLSGKIAKADLDRLDSLLKAAGLPGEAAFEPFRPWFAAVVVSMLPAVQAGYAPASGIDVTLRATMKAAGKRIEGFETVGEQLHFFADLPQSRGVAFLHQTLALSPAAGTALIDQLEAAWQSGDVEAVARLSASGTDSELNSLLITGRNAAWAKALDERLHGAGTSFVAVGMGHLAGPGSLIEDLRKLGYTVTRIE